MSSPILDSRARKTAIAYLSSDLNKNYPHLWKRNDSRVGTFLDNYVRIANSYKAGVNVRGGSAVSQSFQKIYGISKPLADSFVNAFIRGKQAGKISADIVEPVSAARAVSSQNVAVRAEIAAQKATNPSILDRLTGGATTVASSYVSAAKFLPWIAIVGAGAWIYLTFLAPISRGAKTARRIAG